MLSHLEEEGARPTRRVSEGISEDGGNSGEVCQGEYESAGHAWERSVEQVEG